MTFSLNTTIIEPDQSNEIDNAIILLHGYGGDGKDISSLAYQWRRSLKNTIFLCPDGHEKCQINPSGFQWFDLNTDDQNYINKEAIKSELIIKKFINEVKSKYNINYSKICLSGFSQGCMMSINLGFTSNEGYNCIVGFSGKIINENDLRERIKFPTETLLIHGDSDQVVQPNFMLEAKDFFIRNNLNIETHLIKNCGHHIPIEASSIALNYILKKIK